MLSPTTSSAPAYARSRSPPDLNLPKPSVSREDTFMEVVSIPRATVQEFYLAEARFDELTREADVLARVDPVDFAGARA